MRKSEKINIIRMIGCLWMNEIEPPLQIINYKSTGWKKLGQPKKRFLNEAGTSLFRLIS